MRFLRLLLPIAIAVGAVLLVAGLTTEVASSQVTLHTETGAANWFYRDCHDGETTDVGHWFVGLVAGWCDPGLRLRLTNTYPGYRLLCDVYLANTGRVPLVVQAVTVYNPHPEAVTVTAALAPGEAGKVLQPCGYSPAWGERPSRVLATCRTRLNLTIQLGQGLPENARFDYSIAVSTRAPTFGGGR